MGSWEEKKNGSQKLPQGPTLEKRIAGSGVFFGWRTHFQGNNNMIFENYVIMKSTFEKYFFVSTIT